MFVGSGEPQSTGSGVDAIPYEYTLDNADNANNANNVPAAVTAGAGRQANP